MQQTKDVRIILNPAADNGRGGLHQDSITKIAEAHALVDFVVSESGNHARQLAQEAAEAGYSLVIAAGGDGTVHQIVNGIMAVPDTKTMLGVIPIGSGNDFAFANGIPKDVEEAATQFKLNPGNTIPMDFVSNTRFKSVMKRTRCGKLSVMTLKSGRSKN